MTKEELLNYKYQLSLLSELEQSKRNLYLRDLELGNISGPMTGYASIDRPEIKYYQMDKYDKIKTNETVTEAFLRQNKDNLNGVAIEYFLTKITYEKFILEYQKLIKALTHNGISKGDYVSFCLPGIPEAMYSVYALGHIGAVGIYLPPYLDKETMLKDVNKDNSKILIVMDMFYEKFKEVFDYVVNNSSIEKIVVVPTLNSSILGRLKKKQSYEDKKVVTYNDFIKEGKDDCIPPMVKYEENMPLSVVYSSGTTGNLKGILLSHDAFNNSAASYLAFGFDLRKGQVIYQAIPVWSSTGLIADGCSALYYGCTLYQNPQFDPIIYSKNLGLHKINWGIATTELFNGLAELSKQPMFKLQKKLGIIDYSGLKNVYIGGTFSTPNDRNKLNDLLASLGCTAKTRSSWGRCEDGSIVTAELNGVDHPDYSVGIPIPGVTTFAVDEDLNELPYYQRGELVVKTNCGMLRYYNRPDLGETFITEKEELKGFKRTGDIGYRVPTGEVIYEGRANDYSIVNNEKIFNFDVKKAISYDDAVFDSEVFIHPTEKKLCVQIVFKDGIAIDKFAKFRDLQLRIYEIFQDINYVPELFKVRTAFPMASSTKRNYLELKSETDGYEFVDPTETLGIQLKREK